MSVDMLNARYDQEQPGYYCIEHKSVYCHHAQLLIDARGDTDGLAHMLATEPPQNFYVAVPIYPENCVWEVLVYQPSHHPALGPVGLAVGTLARQDMVKRILPGEGAADLGYSMRQNFEDDESVAKQIEMIRTAPPKMPGRPSALPRCASSGHSMRYQKLLTEALDPQLLADEWDLMERTVLAMVWTWKHFTQCLFCWTKVYMQDAIRVNPDFAFAVGNDGEVEPTNFDDLIPTDTPKWKS